MYRYQYVSVEVGGINFNLNRSRPHREIIHAWAAKGWRYLGYIPTQTTWFGALAEVDLIFEQEYDGTSPSVRPS